MLGSVEYAFNFSSTPQSTAVGPIEADAHPPYSPDLLSYSSLSTNIKQFVGTQQKNRQRVGARASVDTPVFSHYLWVFGENAGQECVFQTASSLLRKPGFNKNFLKKIWKIEKGPPHDDSIEIQ